MVKTDTNFYVASSIPYVNGAPHVGHAFEFIICDAIARYQRINGKQVYFSTGADEHGSKIQQKAAELGITPERLAEQNVAVFKDLIPLLGVEYSRFIRTTEKTHLLGVAEVWKRLAPYIYKGSYSGLYDVREETFITTEEAKNLMKTDPVRYDRLQKLEEDNYFFKLSEFTEPVLEAIQTNKLRIIPETRRNEILKLLSGGLNDISVSRPADKVGWGIDVPGDPKQKIYVWFEALINYLTTLDYPDGENFKNFWPCDVHVIGKDITRFHAAIWPAMLLGLKLELPKSIYVHGFITIDAQKMSKSVGNVISPVDMVSTYGSDATRYYFLRHIPSYDDGDFSWVKMESAYNNELANELGNLVSRTATMISSSLGGHVSDLPKTSHDDGAYREAIEAYKFDQALDNVWQTIKSLNQYVDEQKPWTIKDDPAHLNEVLAYLVASLLQLSVLLAPFLPSTSARIKEIFTADKIAPPKPALFPKINKYTKS